MRKLGAKTIKGGITLEAQSHVEVRIKASKVRVMMIDIEKMMIGIGVALEANMIDIEKMMIEIRAVFEAKMIDVEKGMVGLGAALEANMIDIEKMMFGIVLVL